MAAGAGAAASACAAGAAWAAGAAAAVGAEAMAAAAAAGSRTTGLGAASPPADLEAVRCAGRLPADLTLRLGLPTMSSAGLRRVC